MSSSRRGRGCGGLSSEESGSLPLRRRTGETALGPTEWWRIVGWGSGDAGGSEVGEAVLGGDYSTLRDLSRVIIVSPKAGPSFFCYYHGHVEYSCNGL